MILQEGRLRGVTVAMLLALVGCGSRTQLAVDTAAAGPTEPDPAKASCTIREPGSVVWASVTQAPFRGVSAFTLRSDAAGNALLAVTDDESGGGTENELSQSAVAVTKVTADGSPSWTTLVGSTDPSTAGALAVDPPGAARIVTALDTHGLLKPVLSELSQDGTVTRKASLTKDDGPWFPIAVRSDQTLSTIVLGLARGPVNLGGGSLETLPREFFLARFGRAGGHEWSKKFGGSVTYLDFDGVPSGELTLSGTLTGEVTFGDVKFSSATQAPFVASLRADGSTIFAHLFPSTSSTTLLGVVRDAKQNSYVALSFGDSLDLGSMTLQAPEPNSSAIIKLNATGAVAWAKVFGRVHSLSVGLSAHGLLVGGSTKKAVDLGSGPFGGDGWSTFAAKLDTNGAVSWVKRLNGTAEFAPRVAAGACDGVLLAGTFRGTFDAGTKLLHSSEDALSGTLESNWSPVVMLLAP